MTTATVKLYASLSGYLPQGARRNAVELTLPDDSTVTAVLERLKVPPAQCHLILLNGLFVAPSRRAGLVVKEGDTIAVWPPVAGG